MFGGRYARSQTAKLRSATDVLEVVNRIEGILVASIGQSDEEEAAVARDVEWLESQRERIAELLAK